MTGSSIFATNTKTHQYAIKFHCHSLQWSALAGCFFLSHWQWVVWILDGALVKGWGLCATVELRGIEWRPQLSLNYHFSWLWSLCGPYQGLFHLFTFNFFSWVPCMPSGPPIFELAWYYHLGANLGEKIYHLGANLGEKIYHLGANLGEKAI